MQLDLAWSQQSTLRRTVPNTLFAECPIPHVQSLTSCKPLLGTSGMSCGLCLPPHNEFRGIIYMHKAGRCCHYKYFFF